MHKTKFFKSVFENNADYTVAYDKADKKVIHTLMSEDTFVPLMGQMWSKAKARYRKRNEKDAAAFAEYCLLNFVCREGIKDEYTWYGTESLIKHSIGELYEIWKDERKRTT